MIKSSFFTYNSAQITKGSKFFAIERHKNLKARLKEDIKFEFNHCCAYCGSNSKRLSLDHVNAESKGGTDSWKNLVPACVKCNASKGSKNLIDWYTASLPFYCEDRLQRILNRCGKKTSTFTPLWAKGFDPGETLKSRVNAKGSPLA